MPEPVRYRVSMSRPHSHLFEVEATFPAQNEELIVSLPVWTPGSYLVREYSRHVQEFNVVDDAGKPVPFKRVDKRSYVILPAGKSVRCQYKVYANELTVRTSHLDGTHGYFNGATLFFYSEKLRNRPHHVTVDAPAGWKTTVALDHENGAFVASDYDELVDSPFEVGTHTPITFTAAGVPHEVVMWGDPQLDEKKLVSDLTRIIETEAALFGGLPMKRYVFFIYGTDKGRGGLEHKASTALLYPRNGFASARGWEDFLTLCAHEYFHLWNVKRVKPKALVPFDYAQENYTELLWFFEGGTSYYDNLITRRAGLMSAQRYLTRFGESLTLLHTTPGRKVLPLVESSLVSWIKHYRPDENSPNTAISYYLKGEIVCALLDLHIRKATNDQKSLDDLLRVLWAKYGNESGVPENGIEAAAEELGGQGLRDFFQHALRGTHELSYDVFEHVGLEVKLRPRESASDKGGTPPRGRGDRVSGWLGIVPRGAFIASVLEGSPAMAAGLYSDDEVIALDGLKCDASSLGNRVEDRKPGETVKITVFRREKLLELPVTVAAKPADGVYLQRVERPTDAQRTAYQSWLGAAWNDVEAALNAAPSKV
ncbi:MAG: peptidase M61 [Archangium gephyra]|uniref:Peptidase M61 n=1 Tax=Archangium gephyra TaxID=48 RepID=A0A2W5TTL0_9BACT|nr:MAG: peptidase M61 [Archangium gephyra]